VPNIASATASPATSIVTTAETLAANIPQTPLTLPGGSPVQVIIRGQVAVTTGAATTAVQVKLRVGQNNTTTAQVAQTEQIQVAASTLEEIPFHFTDPATANLTVNGGYSITVTQVAATGNGTVTQVEYEVATTP
jgi:hypothetical protein